MTRLKQTGLDATIKFCESIWLVEINPIYAAQKFNHLSHIVWVQIYTCFVSSNEFTDAEIYGASWPLHVNQVAL